MRLIDAEDTINQIAQIAKALAKSDKQKALCGRIIYMLEHRPTIKAIPLDRVEQIRTEINKFSPTPTAEDVIDGNAVKDAIWETLIEVDKIIDKAIKEQSE